MSREKYSNFESNWKKKSEREHIRIARENVLADAEKRGLKELERRKKEESWMLPNLEQSLDDNDRKSRKRKKEKKSKKHKKEKKSKKKKKRRERSSSSSSSSESEDEWVEKGNDQANSSTKREPSPVKKRESWMDFGLMAEVSTNSKDDLPNKKSQKTIEREKREETQKQEWLKRELNPNILKEHGIKTATDSTSSKDETDKNKSNSWIERAFQRAKEQAKREGRTIEEVAKERFGSLDKFKNLLSKSQSDGSSSSRRESKEDYRSSSSRSGWKTEARREKEKQAKVDEHRNREKRSPSAERSPVRKDSKDEPKNDVKNEANEGLVVMSEKEMNALGAKIVKFEILGKDVTKLKAKLEKARQAQELKKAGQLEEQTTEETVVLTRTDAKGFSRPIQADVINEGKSRKGKVQTHADGQRVRYFADDDRYDLKQMFEREKLSTAEDQNLMMSRLAGKAIERTDDDYSIDDVFTSRAAKKRSEEQDMKRDRDQAIAEHKEMSRTLDECRSCFDGAEFKKHLLVAIGKTCYVSLPPFTSLTEDHCFIIPMSHVKCGTLLDEDVFSEMQTFRAALCKMFEDDDRDCVFFEIATGLKRHPHMVLECVPIPRENGEFLPMYFQKAIQESESEWSHNKKLISLTNEKNIRRSVPKGLPYFHVDFGMQNGFAHVIEDEHLFPRNFAQGKRLF